MKATMISLHDCNARDLDDPLAPLRQQFDLPAGVIYLDGNSLAPVPGQPWRAPSKSSRPNGARI